LFEEPFAEGVGSEKANQLWRRLTAHRHANAAGLMTDPEGAGVAPVLRCEKRSVFARASIQQGDLKSEPQN
jgi:hypothetical protein